MAGPETALATGRPDLGELGPITEPAAAPVSATPSSAQIAQGQEQVSKAYSLDPNHRIAREQRDPVQLKQGQWLGNGQMAQGQASGGDPLFAATMAVPTFEVDQQISGVRQQKAQLADWMSKQSEQFKGKAADPYQPAYEKYVGDEQGKFIQDVADTYADGDVNAAWKIVQQDPEIRAQWDRNNRHLLAIGQANKGGYDYYEKVDKDVRDGNTEVDPETKKLLDSGLNAEWSFNGMGAAHNAAQFDRLNDRLSMNKLFDDFYQPSVKDAGDVKADKWSVESKNGRKFLVIPSEKSYNEFVNSFVEKAMKDGPYRDKDEVRRFVEARVPRANTVKVTQLALPRSSGSGSGSSAGGDNKIHLSAERTNQDVGDGSVGVKIFGTTSGAPTIMRPLYFNQTPVATVKGGRAMADAANNPMVSAIPVMFKLDKDGKLILDAKRTKEPSADKSSTGGNKDADSEEPMTEKQFNELPNITFRNDAVNPALEAIANDRGLRTPAGLADVDAARKIVIEGIRERESTSPSQRKESKPFVDQTKPAVKAKPLAKGSLDDI